MVAGSFPLVLDDLVDGPWWWWWWMWLLLVGAVEGVAVDAGGMTDDRGEGLSLLSFLVVALFKRAVVRPQSSRSTIEGPAALSGCCSTRTM